MGLEPSPGLYAEIGCRVGLSDATVFFFKHTGASPPRLALAAKRNAEQLGDADLVAVADFPKLQVDLEVRVDGLTATARADVGSGGTRSGSELAPVTLVGAPTDVQLRCGINFADSVSGLYEVRIDDVRIEVCDR